MLLCELSTQHLYGEHKLDLKNKNALDLQLCLNDVLPLTFNNSPDLTFFFKYRSEALFQVKSKCFKDRCVKKYTTTSIIFAYYNVETENT